MITTPFEVDSIVMEASSPDEKSFMRQMPKSEVNQINATLVSSLYKNILKYNHCDFGDIPKSKGDIHKVKGMKELIECMDILIELHTKYGIPTQDIMDIRTSINTISRLVKQFEFGFKTNTDYLIILYNTMVMAIMDATSMIIADFTQYLISPTEVKYIPGLSRSNKNRGRVSIDALKRFNYIVTNGSLDSTISSIVTTVGKSSAGTGTHTNVVEESLTAMAAGKLITPVIVKVVAAMVAAGLAIIGPKIVTILMRDLIFYFYRSKVRLSDYLELQASFLEMNKSAVLATNKPASQKEKILQKQEKVILKLRRLSDKIKINAEDTSDIANQKLKEENKKLSLSKLESQMISDKMGDNPITII